MGYNYSTIESWSALDKEDQAIQSEPSQSAAASSQQWVGKTLSEQVDFVLRVINSLNHPFTVIDANDYMVKLMNTAAAARALPEATRCYELSHARHEPCESADHPCPIQEVRRTKQPCVVEHVHYDAEGQERYFEVHAHPIFDSEGNVKEIIEYCFDITARKRLEDERNQLKKEVTESQKWESLGALAGGIAHEFNNLLVSIMGNSELALLELPNDHPVRRRLEEVIKASRRAAETTYHILSYCGHGTINLESLNINSTVNEVVELVRASLPSNISLEAEVSDALPALRVDKRQFSHLLLSLLTNAVEAIGDLGGKIRVKAGTSVDGKGRNNGGNGCNAGEEETAVGSLENGALWLEVSDTGCGMSENTASRVFEPFFTTKFQGRGLGLSATWGIMMSYGGTIRVWSKEGLGSRFRLHFPLSQSSAEAALNEIALEKFTNSAGNPLNCHWPQPKAAMPLG
jgi:signal transduction histidine kinase